MWPKLNTMKHFVTLAALLTSLSAFAQLPYNPDANNDGHIGAFDLTSLLSVYSGNFSNGVLGEGTEMAELEVYDWAAVFKGNSTAINSWVVDLSLIPSYLPDNVFTGPIELDFPDIVNGTTVTILKPSNWVSTYGSNSISASTFTGDFFWGEITGLDGSESFCAKLVFWNGEWLSLHPAVHYYAWN